MGPIGQAVALAGALMLSWQDNSAVESRYEVWRQEGNQSHFNRVMVLPANTTAWIDNNTTINQRYCYLVVAYRNSERGFSNVKCAKEVGGSGSISQLRLNFSGISQYVELIVDE